MVPKTSCFPNLDPDFRELDIDDVAKLALGVVGDSYLNRISSALSFADVLVLFGVEEIAGNVRHFCSAVMRKIDRRPQVRGRARSLSAL